MQTNPFLKKTIGESGASLYYLNTVTNQRTARVEVLSMCVGRARVSLPHAVGMTVTGEECNKHLSAIQFKHM